MNGNFPNFVPYLASVLGVSVAVMTAILIITAFWTIIWKGLGLWRAARNNNKWWFLAFLVINDLGLLEIIYLLWFAKKAAGNSSAA